MCIVIYTVYHDTAQKKVIIIRPYCPVAIKCQNAAFEQGKVLIQINNGFTANQRCHHLRLSQYCKLCRMMTEEKNKYIKLKQIASQTIAELTEQVKVQENEAEIQRTMVINMDR